MKITDITLHNFKSFEGTHKICGLAEDISQEQPVVLFGGLNGAGKTSIFESLLLCLYGKFNKTLWPSRGANRESYLSYITSIINSNAKRESLITEMFVEIGLEQVELGGTSHTLRLRRTWEYKQDSEAKEKGFRIVENGSPIDYVSEDEYTEFVKNELIPYEVAEFFFFDGEKIQDFIKDEDEAFEESLESVLGIGLYKTLREDLDKVRRQIQKDQQKDQDVEVRLLEIDRNIADAKAKITKLEAEKENLEEEDEDLEKQIEKINKETHRITRTDADSKEELDSRRASLRAEKERLNEDVFAAVQDSLPFIIMSDLVDETLEQLEQEREAKENLAAKQRIQSEADTIAMQLFEGDEPEPPLLEHQKNFYLSRLRQIFFQKFGVEDREDINILHDLSESDAASIRRQSENTRGVVNGLTNKLSRLSEITPMLKKMDQAEQRATNEETQRLFEEKGKLEQQRADRKAEIERIEVRIGQLKEEIQSLKRRRTVHEDKVVLQGKMRAQVEYCKKLKEALEQFSVRFRMQKLEQLQKYTLEMWRLLARKQDQVSDLKITSEGGFSINLFDAYNKPIDKTKLSAGEKEILAISLIYALRKLTNRNLPIIIDTPLGRLDSKHRTNITEKYFPNASHQVILLSTDTEIVQDEYEAIKPHLAQQLLIQKDSASESSYIQFGKYFS